MYGHLERLPEGTPNYILRIGETEGRCEYGDPYCFACVVTEADGKVAELRGLNVEKRCKDCPHNTDCPRAKVTMSLKVGRKIRDVLTEHGFDKAVWVRIKGGQEHRAEFDR